jgi:hypothetical protein
MAKGNKPNHRRFGNIRQLPSGRYQASYLGPDGRRHNAPETYERKSDAERALSLIEAEIVRGGTGSTPSEARSSSRTTPRRGSRNVRGCVRERSISTRGR